MHPEWKRWAGTQVFRAWTAVAALVLLALCFLYRPELLSWYFRTTANLIEAGASLLPYPWGDRIEVVLRAVGGHVWFQLALAIILVRIVAWLPLALWRRGARGQRPERP